MTLRPFSLCHGVAVKGRCKNDPLNHTTITGDSRDFVDTLPAR